jgi:hypothetical protein
MMDIPLAIDAPSPPPYVQLAQAPASPLKVVPSQTPAPAQRQPQQPIQAIGPGLYPPEQPAQAPPSAEAPSDQIEVTPLDVGRYIPSTALYATLIITVTPPTGIVEVYTPGFEASPVLFKGPKTGGEIRLNGPTVYVHLANGATGYSVQYLSYRAP